MPSNKPITEKYLNETLEKRFNEQKSELVEIKDEIMSELSKIRDNQDAHQFSHMRINDDLQDHEKRIKKLEKSPN